MPTGTIWRKLRRLLLGTFRTNSWPPRLPSVATQRRNPSRSSKPSGMGHLSQKNFTKIGEAADAQPPRNSSRLMESSTDPEIKRGVVKDPRDGEPEPAWFLSAAELVKWFANAAGHRQCFRPGFWYCLSVRAACHSGPSVGATHCRPR